jgi:hypothetical protein
MPNVLATWEKLLPKKWMEWRFFGMRKQQPFSHLWRFRNLLLMSFSICVVLMATEMAWFQSFLDLVKNLQLLGVFLGGMLFASSFTVTTGVVILSALVHSSPVWILAIVAGTGAAFADLTIFELVRSGIADELKDLFHLIDQKLNISRHLEKKLAKLLLPLIGAFIIASPLPDELGVGLLGVSSMRTYQFILLSLLLNIIGIFSLVVILA